MSDDTLKAACDAFEASTELGPRYYDRKGKRVSMYEGIQLVADEKIRCLAGDVFDDNTFVSTIFLGFDHCMGFRTKPVLFETMIFDGRHGGQLEDLSRRYRTEAEAFEGHDRIVESIRRVRESLSVVEKRRNP